MIPGQDRQRVAGCRVPAKAVICSTHTRRALGARLCGVLGTRELPAGAQSRGGNGEMSEKAASL